ncbi:branched-chain amino acid ABC transporter permease [Blastococcus sp. SYSU DS0533]
MSTFVELLINGVSLGAIYALLALGFVVIYQATEVVNFTHGSMLLLGIYVIAVMKDETGWLTAVVLGLVAAAVFALVVERLLIAPLRRRGAGHDVALIMTIGLNIVLLTDLTRRIGSNVLDVGGPWGSEVVSVGPVNVPLARLLALLVGLVLLGGFFAALKWTSWGISTRATAENAEAAALMGVRLGRVAAGAWVLAGVLAVVAGVFLVSFPTPGFGFGVAQTALAAFPAAIIGGMSSAGGALVGGLVVGIAETLVTGYGQSLSFLGSGLGPVTPWILMLLVLLVRPAGLFGAKEAVRV